MKLPAIFRRRADHRAEPVEHTDLSPEPVPLAKAWEAPLTQTKENDRD